MFIAEFSPVWWNDIGVGFVDRIKYTNRKGHLLSGDLATLDPLTPIVKGESHCFYLAAALYSQELAKYRLRPK